MKQSKLSLFAVIIFGLFSLEVFGQCNSIFGINNENLTNGVVKHNETTASGNTKDFYIYDDGTYTDYRNPRHRYMSTAGNAVAYKIKGYSNDPKKKKAHSSSPPSGGYYEDVFPTFSGPVFIATSWKHAVTPLNYVCNAPYYAIIVQNCTNSVGSGKVEFYYKSSQALVSSLEPIRYSYTNNLNWFTNLQQTNETGDYDRKIKLDFSGLQIGERRAFYVPLAHNNLPMFASVHTKVRVTINNIANPCGPPENADFTHTSSVIDFPHDPNYIDIIPSCLDANRRNEKRKVLYTIHFQNIGPGPAENIKVIDFLSKYIDPSTVHVVKSKHPVTSSQIQGIGNNEFVINFLEINLPGAAQQGYDMDHEKTKSWVTIAACLKAIAPPIIILDPDDLYCVDNHAAIYFDTQPPVYTPMATICEEYICSHTPYEQAALRNVKCGPIIRSINDTKSIIYPNPFNAELVIESNLLSSGCHVRITNLQGQIIYTDHIIEESNTLSIDTKGFSNGMFIVQLSSGTEIQSFKVAKY